MNIPNKIIIIINQLFDVNILLATFNVFYDKCNILYIIRYYFYYNTKYFIVSLPQIHEILNIILNISKISFIHLKTSNL